METETNTCPANKNNNFSMEYENSLSHLEQPATDTYPERN